MSGKHKKKNGKSVNKKQNNKKICDQLIEVTKESNIESDVISKEKSCIKTNKQNDVEDEMINKENDDTGSEVSVVKDNNNHSRRQRILKLHHKTENRTVKRILDEDMDDIGSPEGANAFEESYAEYKDDEDIVERAKTKAKEKVSEKSEKYRRRSRYVIDVFMNKPFKTSIVLSFIMLMFIESMSRRSLGGAVNFIFDKPLIFILNWLIVLAPFLLSIAVKRKPVVYFLFTVIWGIIGITDYYMLSFRTTPFTGVDLQISTNEISVALGYLGSDSTKILLSLLVTLLLSVVLWIFCPKSKVTLGRVKSLLLVVGGWLLIYLTIIISIATGVLTTKFGNLGISYHDYGIAYCFTMTIVDTGISEPKDYSEEKIYDLVNKEFEKDKDKQNEALPNIIFLQLESFIDLTEVKGIEFSEDPTPNWRKLRKKYSSGYLTVPTIVAGTCNTEFESITGMSLEFFGPGEYPYKTILKQTACESTAFDLKKIGYTAHGIHNHTSGFYGRNEVYANMGFDTFTGVELMHDTSKTANGRWTKDDVLTGCIMDSLKSTKGKDYVYTVSVQGHGVYQADLPEEEQIIEVSGIEDKDLLRQYIYYVNQTKQMDNFIKDLTDTLSDYDENVVLVMYGDHIPGLVLSDESFKVKDRTIYNTEYVIWNNFGLKNKKQNYKSYELAAEVLNRVGIHEGTIIKYHQQVSHDNKDYLKNLKSLQYDMLYGEHYVYNGQMPFKKTDIVYGVKDITIDKTSYDDDYIYIEGGYFNNYSKVFINDEKKKAELISSTLLKVSLNEEDLREKNKICIRQINSLNVEFKKSKEYTFKYTKNKEEDEKINDADTGNIEDDEAKVIDNKK